MDPTATPQTVAQAVQAATQQQSQQLSTHSPSVQPPSVHSSTIDNLTCQWQSCGERCDTAESLYDHVCERHVGRKSTNNLNLTCQWGACRTTTVKRDHITSHIRVHVPLKPHKCDFCGKAFKRPQDLKKHVKTHADESVLMNPPQQGNGRPHLGGNTMGQQNGKPGYYAAGHDTPMGNPYSTYATHLGAPAQASYGQATNAGQYAGYGSVSYPNSNGMQDLQSFDTRRRAIEALNDFLGDIKRRVINPQEYYDVGQRLQSSALPLPVGNGYNTGYNTNSVGYSNLQTASLLESFNNGGNMNGGGGNGGGGGMQAALATQGYSLPLPNARTKTDLHEIDRFLEQLQATVYDHSSTGHLVHTNPTADYGLTHHATSYRSSNSPPTFDGMAGVGAISGVSGMSGVSAPAIETPALTPASMSSYNSSGQSPMSSHSRLSLGSSGGNAMYPNLPAVTGMSDLSGGYPTTTSAPASSLASGFDVLDGRRYSGGRLQRQAPINEDTEMLDAIADGASTPKASDAKRRKSKTSSSIDPMLRSESGGDSSSDSAATPVGEVVEDKRQEEWVENIRVIEALKKWVSDRLRNGEFDEENADSNADSAAPADTSKSIEIAKMVEEKMADADREEVKYPVLATS